MDPITTDDLLRDRLSKRISSLYDDSNDLLRFSVAMDENSQLFDNSELQAAKDESTEIAKEIEECERLLEQYDTTRNKMSEMINKRMSFFKEWQHVLQRRPELFERFVESQSSIVVELETELHKMETQIEQRLI